MVNEINKLTTGVIVVVLAAVVVKIVSICIEAQQQEDGEKAIWKRIKKVVMVGIIAICIGGVTEVITSYYADEASEYVAESSGGHHISAGGHPHGGGVGHR